MHQVFAGRDIRKEWAINSACTHVCISVDRCSAIPDISGNGAIVSWPEPDFDEVIVSFDNIPGDVVLYHTKPIREDIDRRTSHRHCC
jgi:hypothetical protein